MGNFQTHDFKIFKFFVILVGLSTIESLYTFREQNHHDLLKINQPVKTTWQMEAFLMLIKSLYISSKHRHCHINPSAYGSQQLKWKYFGFVTKQKYSSNCLIVLFFSISRIFFQLTKKRDIPHYGKMKNLLSEFFSPSNQLFSNLQSTYIYLVHALVSRNFCQKSVRVNFLNFHSVYSLSQKKYFAKPTFS